MQKKAGATEGGQNRDIFMPLQQDPSVMDEVLVDGSYVPAQLLCMNNVRKEIYEAPEENLVNVIASQIVNVTYPQESAKIIYEITKDLEQVYSAMDSEQLENVKNTLCNATEENDLEGWVPDDYSIAALYKKLNTNLLGTPTEVSMQSMEQYAEWDECDLLVIDPADLVEDGDEGNSYKPLLFNVKYGFGTFVHFMKDLHAKSAASVEINVETGSAVVSYPVAEELEMGDTEEMIDGQVEILLQMFAFDTESEVEAPKGFALKARPNGYFQTHLNAFDMCWDTLLMESNFLHPLFLN